MIPTVREKFPGLRPFPPRSVHWTPCRFADRRSPCRQGEKIGQPPASFHPTPRARAGPNLLAMILFEKFGKHQPLNRQAERHATEGVEISLSTLADRVGACAAALEPIHALIRTHVLGADRLHGPSRQICPANRRRGQWMPATVPLLAKGGTRTARLWTCVRDDRPFAGGAPPAALFHFSRDREMAHPNRHLAGWRGILPWMPAAVATTSIAATVIPSR